MRKSSWVAVSVSRECGILTVRRSVDMLRIQAESERSGDDAFRWRSITEVQVSTISENRAETSGFHSVDFLRGAKDSTEPIVFSRATPLMSHHFERHVGVKSNMSSLSSRICRPGICTGCSWVVSTAVRRQCHFESKRSERDSHWLNQKHTIELNHLFPCRRAIFLRTLPIYQARLPLPVS